MTAPSHRAHDRMRDARKRISGHSLQHGRSDQNVGICDSIPSIASRRPLNELEVGGMTAQVHRRSIRPRLGDCAFLFAISSPILFLLHCSLIEGVDLEATLIAVDNSAYMVNGDHKPNRLQCQHECVNLICTVKTQNPENTIGLMTMACLPSDCPRVHVTPAVNQEIGPILLTLHEVNKAPRHAVQFEDAMRMGWMSLKHRMNKNQRPRIVAFVGSPLKIHDAQDLVRWGKKLRKNNVAVDIISFGESPDVNTPTLQAFVNAVCKDGNSRLLSLPPDACPPGGLSDALFSSAILRDAQPAAPGAPPPAQPDLSEFGGVNPELDPELAMALKMSAQEEKERIEREAAREKEALARSAAAAKREEGGGEGGGGAGGGGKDTGGEGGGGGGAGGSIPLCLPPAHCDPPV